MPFEKKDDTARLFIQMIVLDGVLLLAGLYMYFQTNNLIWIIGAAILGGVVFIIPTILRIKRQQERDNASR